MFSAVNEGMESFPNKIDPILKELNIFLTEHRVPLLKKLTERENWYELNDKQVLHAPLIDFCFSNWCKLQTKSVIHNRILLDTTNHFISNKFYYYDKFVIYLDNYFDY